MRTAPIIDDKEPRKGVIRQRWAPIQRPGKIFLACADLREQACLLSTSFSLCSPCSLWFLSSFFLPQRSQRSQRKIRCGVWPASVLSPLCASAPLREKRIRMSADRCMNLSVSSVVMNGPPAGGPSGYISGLSVAVRPCSRCSILQVCHLTFLRQKDMPLYRPTIPVFEPTCYTMLLESRSPL